MSASEAVNAEEKTITLNEKALGKLRRAKKEGETYSDVVIRLVSTTLEGLQRRGEMEVSTSDGRKISVAIEQDKCLGAMSCVAMAPELFALDTSQLGVSRKGEEPLGMRDVLEGEIDSETIRRSAESCPYQAILLKDAKTGEQIFP